MALVPVQTALIIHAAAAPVIFAAGSCVYFARCGYTTPLRTATAFVGQVVFRSLCALPAHLSDSVSDNSYAA